MARNQTLLKILTDTRGEARLSLNPAHNLADRDAQIGMIQREQERLWADHDWPHLKVSRYIPTRAGSRYYDPRNAYDENWSPKGDLSMERLIDLSIFDGHRWRELPYGINDCNRFAHDSLAGERSWPPRAWDRGEDDMIELWPMPDEDAKEPAQQIAAPNFQGVIRLRGIRDLRPFRDDGDRADLDDRLLALYAAAAILAEAGAKDVNLKLEAAQRHYSRLKADGVKAGNFSMYGIKRPQPIRHPFVTRYVRAE